MLQFLTNAQYSLSVKTREYCCVICLQNKSFMELLQQPYLFNDYFKYRLLREEVEIYN